MHHAIGTPLACRILRLTFRIFNSLRLLWVTLNIMTRWISFSIVILIIFVASSFILEIDLVSLSYFTTYIYWFLCLKCVLVIDVTYFGHGCFCFYSFYPFIHIFNILFLGWLVFFPSIVIILPLVCDILMKREWSC